MHYLDHQSLQRKVQTSGGLFYTRVGRFWGRQGLTNNKSLHSKTIEAYILENFFDNKSLGRNTVFHNSIFHGANIKPEQLFQILWLSVLPEEKYFLPINYYQNFSNITGISLPTEKVIRRYRRAFFRAMVRIENCNYCKEPVVELLKTNKTKFFGIFGLENRKVANNAHRKIHSLIAICYAKKSDFIKVNKCYGNLAQKTDNFQTANMLTHNKLIKYGFCSKDVSNQGYYFGPFLEERLDKISSDFIRFHNNNWQDIDPQLQEDTRTFNPMITSLLFKFKHKKKSAIEQLRIVMNNVNEDDLS